MVAKMPGAFFGIAVIDEETAAIVDKKLVEIGRNRLVHTELEGYVGDEAGRGLVPVTPPNRTLAELTAKFSGLRDRPPSARLAHRELPRR